MEEYLKLLGRPDLIHLIKNCIDCMSQADLAKLTSLSPRELQILILLGKGSTYRAIANTLYISPLTVHKHLTNLYRKIGAHSKFEAVIWAMTIGIIRPDKGSSNAD